MKEHPALFSTPMIPPILAGNKTQTRRIGERWKTFRPGDRLWVRETWAPATDVRPKISDAIIYKADNKWAVIRWKPSIHMKRIYARIFLTVKNNRLERLQDITEEDAIAEGVAPLFSQSEIQGPPYRKELDLNPMPWRNYLWHGHVGITITATQSDAWPHQYSSYDTARESFSSLWDSINAKRGYPWESNPDVFRIEFEVEK